MPLSSELQDAVARFSSVAEALPQACLLVDAATTAPLASNGRAARFFDHAARETPLLELAEDPQQLLSAFATFASSRSAMPGRCSLKLDGETFTALQVSGSLFSTAENAKTILLTLKSVDISSPFQELSRKLADIQRQSHKLQRDNVELEKRVAQRTKKLELRNEELDLLNQSLNEFVSIVSHDLAGPARRIQSFSNLLERDLDGVEKSGDINDYLRFLTESASRLTQMISGSVRLSRIRPVPSSWELVDTTELLRVVEEDVAALNPGVDFVVHCDTLDNVYADMGLVELLLQNLLNNAVKYRNRDVDLVVEISSSQNDLLGYAEFVVADNGMGISADDQKRVLRPFFRGADTGDIPGTGLGLAMCSRICQQHQGRLWIEHSSIGQDGTTSGTEFRFRLPSEAPE